MKSTFKKILSVGAGALFLGATVLGAAAADLNQYPAPFVKNGTFDAFIVVGQSANSEDVVGAVDIGTSLQFEMRKEQNLDIGQNVLISEGVKIKGTGSQIFNYGEYAGEIRAGFDSDDMPRILADGRYVESEGATDNDEDYTQELELTPTSILGTYDQPDEKDASEYVELSDGDVAWIYNLEFDDAAEYALDGTGSLGDDIEGTQLEIQGNIYTITDSKFYTDGTIKELDMMAGDTVVWLMQDQTVEKTINGVRHEIRVVDVTEWEDSCGVSVDGFVAWIDTRSDKTINGVNIGVLDAKAVHAQLQDVDICQLNLGATELKLKDGDNLERDGEEVKDAEVTIDSTPGLWEGFSVAYTPEDDLYLQPNQEITDPSFLSFKLVMGDTLANYETITVERDGSKKGTLTFNNNDGKELEVPFYYDEDGSEIRFGAKEGRNLLLDGESCDGTEYGDDVEDCKGTLLFAVGTGSNAHIIEVTDINYDGADTTISLKDQTYSRTWSDRLVTDPIDMGSLGILELSTTSTTLTADHTIYGTTIETEHQGTMSRTTNDNMHAPADDNWHEMVTFTENYEFASAQPILIEIKYDTIDEELQLRLNTAPTTWMSEGMEKVYDQDWPEVSATAYGTIAEQNDDKQVTILHPEEQTEINAFIAPVSAEVSTSGWSTMTIDKINVGAARLDTEIQDYTKDNLILVGGPCANRITAQLMNVPFASEPACYDGLQPGEAIIKLYEQPNGKVAMIVSGYNAQDTRRATRVISNFEAYNLHGTETKVTGTSLNDMKVQTPN